MLDADLLEAIEAPALKALALYWAGRAPGRLPARADIDPAAFVPLLGNVFLIDVLHAPALDFRFRLFGTAMVEVYKRDLTGRLLSETAEAFDSALRPDYVKVTEEAHPLLRRGQLEWPGRGHIGYERLILPLAADGCRVDMLLGATLYDLPDFGRRWVLRR